MNDKKNAPQFGSHPGTYTTTDTQVRDWEKELGAVAAICKKEELQKYIQETEDGRLLIAIPYPPETVEKIIKADRAYLAREAQRLIDEENNRPFGVAPVSLKKMLAIINQ